ncbi:MAG: hypothetical protein AAFO99_11525 [Bacteroidota bacterium]
MMKFRTLLSIVILCTAFTGFSQQKVEREHRILCGQFPENGLKTLKQTLKGIDTKNITFYQEIDSNETRFTAKFKKDRLFYRMDFTMEGNLKSIGYMIDEVDIPDEAYDQIDTQLTDTFEKPRTRRMFQQYQIADFDNSEEMLKNAFQNLLSSTVEYKFLITAKNEGTRQYYEVHFDAEGDLKHMRASLPANYDHVLY